MVSLAFKSSYSLYLPPQCSSIVQKTEAEINSKIQEAQKKGCSTITNNNHIGNSIFSTLTRQTHTCLACEADKTRAEEENYVLQQCISILTSGPDTPESDPNPGLTEYVPHRKKFQKTVEQVNTERN